MAITRAVRPWKSTVLGLAAALAAAPAAAKFTPIAGFDQQIFPSYIIATAPMKPASEPAADGRLGDPRGLLGVEVVAPADNAPVTVTVLCDECLEPSTFAGVLPKQGKTYRVFPKVKYKYGWLARCVQAAPVSMTFRVKVGKAAEEEDTVACTVRAVNDCPFTIYEGDASTDVSYTFAAYVNEQHPFVDKLLREALDRGVVAGFDGYQQGNPEAVIRQAYALWDLLVARDIRYSSITVSAVSSSTVASQHVRLIEDSVNNSQANCVDGSVLWASLMQKIGIDSFLVMEPTHCYAGFFTDQEHNNAFAIETTMLGADFTDEDIEAPEAVDNAVPEDDRDDRSWASFVGAINYSTSRLSQSLAKKQAIAEGDEDAAESDESNDAPPCDIIDIAQARQLGVLPIAFQSGAEFVWYDFSDEDGEEVTVDEMEESDEEAAEAYVDGDEESYEEDGEDEAGEASQYGEDDGYEDDAEEVDADEEEYEEDAGDDEAYDEEAEWDEASADE